MFKDKTIMIVDDDSEIRESVGLRLLCSGYKITTAVDGQDAIEKINSCPPDAIVMDSRMPRTDGMTALIDLKSRPETSRIPIVMISASIVDKRQALDAGARFFVAKPYRAADLLNAIRVSLSELTL